jgi:hypothetical protein
MIKNISVKLNLDVASSIFHDSRRDCRNLAMICNVLIDKVNELTDVVNELKSKK